MRIIAFVTDVGSIQGILAYLGEPTKALGIAPPSAVLPREEDFDPAAGTHPSERAASKRQGQGVALSGAPRMQRQDVAGQSTPTRPLAGAGGLASGHRPRLCVPLREPGQGQPDLFPRTDHPSPTGPSDATFAKLN
jgi:hypothetical protein